MDKKPDRDLDFDEFIDGIGMGDQPDEPDWLEIGQETRLRPSDALYYADPDAYREELELWKQDTLVRLRRNATEYLEEFSQDNFEQLVTVTCKDRIIPFVGAGLSVDTGYPTWREFLLRVAQELEWANLSELEELLDQGNFEEVTGLLHEYDENALANQVSRTFGAQKTPTGAVTWLPDIAKHTCLITTNFDKVLERAYQSADAGFEETVLATGGAFFEALSSGKRYLLKLHGSAHDPSSRVLTPGEYEQAYRQDVDDIEPETRLPGVLRRVFSNHRLLFLGCSLLGDRTLKIFKQVASEFTDMGYHFAILERPESRNERETRRRFLSERKILPIWYPPGGYEFVEGYLLLLRDHYLRRNR